MSTTQVLGETPYASPGQPHASLTGRIDALPASFGLWSFITLLSLGGFFELYDLFQTGYISAGLLAEGIFHTGVLGIFRPKTTKCSGGPAVCGLQRGITFFEIPIWALFE